MKKLKPILIMTLVSAFAVLTVVNMSLASPKSGGENTLDMLEIMTRAFDESEGGETTCPTVSQGYLAENPSILAWFCGENNGFTCEIYWFIEGQSQPIETYVFNGVGSDPFLQVPVFCLPDIIVPQ